MKQMKIKIVKLDNGKYGYWSKEYGYLEERSETLEEAIQDAFTLWGNGNWNMSDIDQNNCFTIDIEE